MKALLLAILVLLALNLSSVATPVSAVQYVNCTGDGLDHTRIMAAVGRLPDTGGKVQLPNGICKISGPIVLQDKPVWLAGEGVGWAHEPGFPTPLAGGSIITADPSYNDKFILITSSTSQYEQTLRTAGTMISDLKIFQNCFPGCPSANADGIYSTQTPPGNNVWIRNVSISGVGGAGIMLRGANNWVSMVTVRGAGRNGIWAAGGDNMLVQLDLGGNGLDGLLIGGASVVAGVYSYGNQRNGVYWESGSRVAMSALFLEANAGWGLAIDQWGSVGSIGQVVTNANVAGAIVNLGANVTITGHVSADGR